MGLTYKTKIHDLATGELIHEEDGQWLWNMDPGVDTTWEVTRVGIIPHGVVVVAPGTVAEMTGAEVMREQEAMTQSNQWSIEPRSESPMAPGYFEGKLSVACPCHGACPCETSDRGVGACPSRSTCRQPVDKLLAHIGNVSDMKVTQLQTSILHPGGSLVQLPGIKAQVFNSVFNSTFWIQSPSGGGADDDYDQLQYAQTVTMAFKCNSASHNKEPCTGPEDLIQWPHVQVNTLRKQRLLLGAPAATTTL